jgi:hypothetical protein
MFLLCLLAAYVVIRVSGDLPYAVRGKTPPRHEYRMAKLQHAATNGGQPIRPSPFGRYVSGVIDDAWTSATRRRELMADDREERQARRINHRIDRRRERDSRSDQRREARLLRRTAREAEKARLNPTPGTAPAPSHWPDFTGSASGEMAPLHDASNQDAMTNVVALPRNDTTDQGELPMTNKINAETTGLDSAIGYADDMQSYCAHVADQVGTAAPVTDDAAASCEQAVSNLQAGGVTGKAIDVITEAQEQLMAAAKALADANAQMDAARAAFAAAHEELRTHVGVREAYQAAPGAGSKEFVTAG